MKYIKILVTLYIVLFLSSDSLSYSQTVEAVGFIPNKGQYDNINLDDIIIGKLCGLDHDIWLTDSGIHLVYNNYYQYEDGYDNLEMKHQRIEISNINPISLDSVKFYDSSTNVFNYYLPSCPNGLIDIRSYRKIIIESIVDGVDLEITFSSNNNIITKFISSTSTSEIRLYTYGEDNALLGSYGVNINEEFSIFRYIPAPSYSNLVNDTNFATSDSLIEWFTLFNGGYSNLASLYEGYEGSRWGEDFIQISNSISDSLGNYYTLGNYTVPSYYGDGFVDRNNYSTDIFINKFDNNGTLLWTTYYGSSNNDMPKTIVLNSKNHIYISGVVESFNVGYKTDFPLKPPPNNSYFSDSGSFFIFKLDNDGKQIWSTLLGNGYGVFDYMGNKYSYETSDCDFFSSAKSSKDDIYFSGTTQTTIVGIDKIDSETYASIAGIPIVGDNKSSIWEIPLIDSLNGGRWIKVLGAFSSRSDTLYLRTYPFILKLDSDDNLVWSTYFFTNQPISAMVVDKKDNLYIGGHTTENYLPLKQKGDGFFKDNDLIGSKNRALNYDFGDYSQRERRAYIAEFNKDNTLIWCTYLEDSVDMDGTTTIVSDIAIGVNDNLLVTGYTNNRYFPLLSKAGAYHNDHSLSRALKKDAFIMAFDSLGILNWSTLCVLDSNSWGVSLESVLNGRLFLAIHGIQTTTSYLQSAYLYEFNKNYSLRKIQTLPFRVARVAPSLLNINNTFHSGLTYWIFGNPMDLDFYDAAERFRDCVSPVLNLSYSPSGSLFLSGNLIDYNYSESKFIKPTPTSFMQTEYSWFSYSGNIIKPNNIHHSGFILKQAICDNVNFKFPIEVPIHCIDTVVINIPLKVDSLMFSQFDIVWYKNNIEVDTGVNYTITDEGAYHMVANSIIYSDCPYYSDTVSIVYDTIDLNFREDTVALCVGAGTYVIDAYRFGASYLWTDGSTDSTYTVRYKGDSINIIWCHATNDCGGEDRDTVIVRFYPPFAYLGEDTLLCKGQVLNFDASVLNRSIPSKLDYKWILNGDTVLGTGTNNELFTITENDSGQLILHAIWPESGCKVGIDTLNFAYYQYDDVAFYLPEDTTICFYEDLEIDLIQTLEPNTDTNTIYLCLSSTGDIISKESNFILKEPLLYYISASNYCYKQEDTLKLNYFTDFKIEKLFPTDTILCKGYNFNIDASILNNNIPDTVTLEYEWFLNGESVPGSGTNKELFTITENDSGQLVFHVIWQESGCKLGTDTLNFSYYQYDNVGFYLPNDTSICFYEDLEIDLIANKTDNIDPNTIYLCLRDDYIISKRSSFTLREAFTYDISATNYCSKQEQIFKLNYFTDFNIQLLFPEDTVICKELFPYELYALTEEQRDGICYWLSENKADTIEISPSRYINQDGIYPITLSDIYNCSQDYEITVGIKEDCAPIIDLPNVFTPNSDGVNDVFKIISADNIIDFDIIIFNKAGTKVYEYKGLIENFAWTGTYKNTSKDVPEGAYFFVILYKDVLNATRKQAGTLTLLR